MAEKAAQKNEIFNKPLPVILSEIETAAADARQAADDARTAGEKAAGEVMKRLRKLFLSMAKDITEQLDETKK
jgi:hypothetical protein